MPHFDPAHFDPAHYDTGGGVVPIPVVEDITKRCPVARDPCFLGRFTAGHMRAGVETMKWESQICRLGVRVQWRVANTNVPRDPTTGQWVTTYPIVLPIKGVFAERGTTIQELGVAISSRVDAAIVLMDGVAAGDMIVTDLDHDDLPTLNSEYYLVVDEPVSHYENEGFAFRVCNLHRELSMEPELMPIIIPAASVAGDGAFDGDAFDGDAFDV